jgi:hypothetical protein
LFGEDWLFELSDNLLSSDWFDTREISFIQQAKFPIILQIKPKPGTAS